MARKKKMEGGLGTPPTFGGGAKSPHGSGGVSGHHAGGAGHGHGKHGVPQMASDGLSTQGFEIYGSHAPAIHGDSLAHESHHAANKEHGMGHGMAPTEDGHFDDGSYCEDSDLGENADTHGHE